MPGTQTSKPRPNPRLLGSFRNVGKVVIGFHLRVTVWSDTVLIFRLNRQSLCISKSDAGPSCTSSGQPSSTPSFTARRRLQAQQKCSTLIIASSCLLRTSWHQSKGRSSAQSTRRRRHTTSQEGWFWTKWCLKTSSYFRSWRSWRSCSSNSVHGLGVLLDNELTMRPHINKIS